MPSDSCESKDFRYTDTEFAEHGNWISKFELRIFEILKIPAVLDLRGEVWGFKRLERFERLAPACVSARHPKLYLAVRVAFQVPPELRLPAMAFPFTSALYCTPAAEKVMRSPFSLPPVIDAVLPPAFNVPDIF